MLYENFLYPQIEEAFLYLKHIFNSFYIAFWSSYLILSNISPLTHFQQAWKATYGYLGSKTSKNYGKIIEHRVGNEFFDFEKIFINILQKN